MFRKSFMVATLALGLIATGASAAAPKSGAFHGLNGKSTTGSVSISKDASGYIVTLGSDFRFSGAPDPKIGFGSGGRFAQGTLVGLLQSNNGMQSFRVPAHIDVSQFTEIHLWCEEFNVGLGVAPIN